MAYTGEEIFERSMAVMDSMNEDGTVSQEDVADYKGKAANLLDIWSKRMAKTAGKKKTFEMSCFRRKNLLGDLNQLGKITENNGTIDQFLAMGANCFYLEVDGDCTVTFSENGGSISGKYSFNGGVETDFTDTINITVPAGTTSFLPIRGILSPASQASTITMSIAGTYYFRHNNRALCPYKYASADKVPDFKPYYKINMPTDLISRTQIITEFPSQQYNEGSAAVKWENDNEMYVMFSYEGLIRINYVSLPAKITSLDQEIEYPENVAMSAVPYLVKHFARADMNDDMTNDAKEEFRQMFADSSIQEPLSPTEIIDVYAIGGD